MRTGYVALVGRPNVGKSTLMNQLVGQKLSIVAAKAQTTWRRVAGIRTSDEAQAIFLDTPGLFLARDLLQRGMLEEALEAIREADVVVLLVDATDPLQEKEKTAIVEALAISSVPRFVVINKIDRAGPEDIVAAASWKSGRARGDGQGHVGSAQPGGRGVVGRVGRSAPGGSISLSA